MFLHVILYFLKVKANKVIKKNILYKLLYKKNMLYINYVYVCVCVRARMCVIQFIQFYINYFLNYNIVIIFIGVFYT